MNLTVFDATLEDRAVLGNRLASVSALAWNPNGDQLASAFVGDRVGSTEEDDVVTVWDMVTRQPIMNLQAILVPDVDWDMTGSQLATVNGYWEYREITVWDVANGEAIASMQDNFQTTTSVAWNPVNNILASISLATPTVWDVESRLPLFIIEEDGSAASDGGSSQALSWSPDGNRLAFVSNRNVSKSFRIILWNVGSDEQPHILDRHTGFIHAIEWQPEGDWLASASGDHTVIVWDTLTEEQVEVLNHENIVRSLSWSPDGSQLATVTFDGKVSIWGQTEQGTCQ
jgi:WD40 repeat protein